MCLGFLYEKHGSAGQKAEAGTHGRLWGYELGEEDVRIHFPAGRYMDQDGNGVVVAKGHVMTVSWPHGDVVSSMERADFDTKYRPLSMRAAPAAATPGQSEDSASQDTHAEVARRALSKVIQIILREYAAKCQRLVDVKHTPDAQHDMESYVFELEAMSSVSWCA